MWLLHGGTQVQERLLLKDYGIAKEGLILLVSRLNKGANG